MHWNKLKIHRSCKTTDDDIRDFVEWVYRKAERLGFDVDLEMYQETESGSSDILSTNPLDKSDDAD